LIAVFLRLAMTGGAVAVLHGRAVLVEGDVADPVHGVLDTSKE
jgi:hypothetical protein